MIVLLKNNINEAATTHQKELNNNHKWFAFFSFDSLSILFKKIIWLLDYHTHIHAFIFLGLFSIKNEY